MKLTKIEKLQGEISVPGDKSISHRAVMFGSLAKGTTHISNFLAGADCLATIDCFRKMGIEIEQEGTDVTVYRKVLHGLEKPEEILDVGNSGTTTRLISGILAGQDFEVVLSGDASLNQRPMKRIMTPLSLYFSTSSRQRSQSQKYSLSPMPSMNSLASGSLWI